MNGNNGNDYNIKKFVMSVIFWILIYSFGLIVKLNDVKCLCQDKFLSKVKFIDILFISKSS